MDQKIYLIPESARWANIQDLAQNAVVQVFAQIGRFNWIEPYKIEDQFENRGSGFFINPDGYFITNAHVVEEAKQIWVQIPAFGKHPLHAEIVGFCPDHDVALLRIREQEMQILKKQLAFMPYFSFGDSDAVMKTESVLVLGYPLGQFYLKSTSGMVSGRELIGGQSLIQITAPINPGNSGGPLINMRGEVIGIALAGVLMAQNVGYALPINQVRMVLDDLFHTPFVRRPRLGVNFSYGSDEMARFFGNPVPAGIYISNVLKNSLFEKAGVQSGDMLYKFNDFVIDAYGDCQVPWTLDKVSLYEIIARLHIDDEMHLITYRNGEKKEFTFKYQFTDMFPIRYMYPEYEKGLD